MEQRDAWRLRFADSVIVVKRMHKFLRNWIWFILFCCIKNIRWTEHRVRHKENIWQFDPNPIRVRNIDSVYFAWKHDNGNKISYSTGYKPPHVSSTNWINIFQVSPFLHHRLLISVCSGENGWQKGPKFLVELLPFSINTVKTKDNPHICMYKAHIYDYWQRPPA